jgi:hypothetical protein
MTTTKTKPPPSHHVLANHKYKKSKPHQFLKSKKTTNTDLDDFFNKCFSINSNLTIILKNQNTHLTLL